MTKLANTCCIFAILMLTACGGGGGGGGGTTATNSASTTGSSSSAGASAGSTNTAANSTSDSGGNTVNGSTNTSTNPVSNSDSSNTTQSPTASVLNYKSMQEVKAPADMTWQLSSAKSMTFTIKYANNTKAAGTVIRLFTYTTTDPHAEQLPPDVPKTVTEPVALSLIDTLVTNSNGQANWQINLPEQLGSVLAVISDGTKTSSQVVYINKTGTVTLLLPN